MRDHEVRPPLSSLIQADCNSTLFWAGSTYAPSFTVDGQDGDKVNIQDFLQEAFLRAIGKLSDAVGDLDSVIGIEVNSLTQYLWVRG